MAASDSLSTLDKRLASLRDFPVDNAGCSDTVLAELFKYLMTVPPTSSDGCLHWFCSRAPPTTIGAATFLIRLFAYSSPLVEDWRKKFRSCLNSCTGCVQGLQDAKSSSKNTYFGAFSSEVLIGFYQSFEKWEATTVVEDLGHQPLAAAHPAISFRIVTNFAILLDPQILDIIQREPPTDYIHGWPSDPLPPGLFLLLGHESLGVRTWAKKQTSQSSTIPMSRDTFSQSHVSALEALCEALDLSQPPRTPFPFAKTPEVLWESFSDVLRQVPTKYHQKGTIFRIVNRHLHDVGSHFQFVLDSFEHLTGHAGRSFWEEEGPEYPQVIFDSIKENASFAELLRQHTAAHKEHPHLSWCSVYLSATKGLPSQAELIAKMADFLCEELQHERFAEARPSIMLTALNLFSDLFSLKAVPSTAMSKFFDIHASIIVDVAFSKSYNTASWTTARHAACQLMKTVMLNDINTISRAISSLCGSLAKKAQIDEEDISLTGGPQLWAKVYQALQPSDHDGMSVIVEALAQAAHLDILSPKPFAKSQFDQLGVNRAMPMIWAGLRDAFTRFTDSSRSTSLLDFLRRPGVVRNVFVLLLSPIEDIQLGAQSLVGFAFDVDGRQDCYRALLENHPDAALDGLFASLNKFTEYATIVTEACSLAKHLVQYLQDVVEVLCTRSDGLLFSSRFLRPEDKTGPCSRLPALWNLLNKAITVVFKRTPLWANYFENEEMIIWMRDALIYGRDLLDKFRVFETAANSRSDVQHDTGGLSKIGQQMADDLQRVLPELARWLRLSNEELLYQMFELLQSLLNVFHQTQVRPLEASLQKMTKHISDARKDNTKSRLDESRLLRLENTIALFTEEPEKIVVRIDEPKPRTKGPEKPPKKAERPVKPPARSNGKGKADEFFTAKDQQKLDSLEAAVPTFRRSAVAGPSKSRPSSVAPSVTSVHSSEAEEQSSSDDEQEQESQGTLASLSNLQRSTKVKQPHVPQRQIKLLDVVQNPVQQRAERRLQAKTKLQRLKPDLSGLYKTILSWSYHHVGAHPSGPPFRLTHVPVDRFTDYDHYFRVFEPLLYLECWAQIVQSKDEVGEVYPFKINARQYVDDWIDIDMTYNGSVKREWRLTESDVVLLQQGALSVLGKVEQYKTPMGKAIEAKVRCLARLDPGLALDTEWQVLQVFSLSTVTREYAALLGLTYFDLSPSILRPALPPIPTPNKANVQKIMALYRVNEPQAVAISSCLDTDGFSLIQGPPGTGKTSTIVALVLAYLANRSRKITAPNAKNNKPEVSQKILICAPSNAAIDEIAHRIRDSETFKSKGRSIVRLGAIKAMNQNVVDISLDQLVDNKLDLGKDTGAVAELASLRAELEAVKAQRTAKLQELDAISDNSTRAVLLSDEITRLNARRTSLSKRYDEVKDNRIKESRGLEQSRRAHRLQVLQGADVICATLSGSGSDVLQDLDIEMVIIDEASQAIELSALIPLKYQPKHSILVGDPQQLPPTVLSQEASKFRYNESLFVRLQKVCPNSMHLLSIQYRMHPTISQLPSALFYQARLKDGPDMARKTDKPWHKDPVFGVYRFLDVKSVEEKSGRSVKNTTECQVAVALFSRLRRAFNSTDFDGQVGVISMYRAQIFELRRQFTQAFGADVLHTVDFNTVDGFQGQEKTIIILSCVRAGPGLDSIGFLSDVRRMNVALTRAKSSLFILGNAPTLSRSDPVWNSIITDARDRASLVSADVSYFTASRAAVQNLPPAPTKPKAITPVTPVPSDLITPREMKMDVDRRTSTVIEPPPPDRPPPPIASAPPQSLKRKPEASADEPSSSKVPKPNPKPRPPRPKDPSSIFIPKKRR